MDDYQNNSIIYFIKISKKEKYLISILIVIYNANGFKF